MRVERSKHVELAHPMYWCWWLVEWLMSKEGGLLHDGEICQYPVTLLQILDCAPMWMIVL